MAMLIQVEPSLPLYLVDCEVVHTIHRSFAQANMSDLQTEQSVVYDDKYLSFKNIQRLLNVR
jgi:UDP-N-acetyl-D-mannosaminuronate dehydrogenase